MSQLEASPEPGVWLMFDKSKRIAILRYVEVRGEQLLRVVTYDSDPSQRVLIGYFPPKSLRLAAEVTWREYVRATGNPRSNLR